ncbi:hypothetical protein EGI20_18465, partial [Aquitalea sp. S1-19]|nr:hypothetical protein [Aquitalea sp. S1-19]
MSVIALMGALEIGLIFALVALGVLISFRILNFPDLTADGSFPLGGALYVQTQGGADISMGIGTIVVGLAAVIIGETLIPSRKLWVITLATVLGALLYRILIALAL